MKIIGLIICFLLPGLLMSCADQEVKEAEKLVSQDILVGRVASINKQAGYLLIQRYKKFSVSENTIFYTRSEAGTVGGIKVSGQELGQFLAADLVTGEHAIGDAVFMRELVAQQQVNDSELDGLKPSEE